MFLPMHLGTWENLAYDWGRLCSRHYVCYMRQFNFEAEDFLKENIPHVTSLILSRD